MIASRMSSEIPTSAFSGVPRSQKREGRGAAYLLTIPNSKPVFPFHSVPVKVKRESPINDALLRESLF
jgi:hypothetical protein